MCERKPQEKRLKVKEYHKVLWLPVLLKGKDDKKIKKSKSKKWCEESLRFCCKVWEPRQKAYKKSKKRQSCFFRGTNWCGHPKREWHHHQAAHHRRSTDYTFSSSFLQLSPFGRTERSLRRVRVRPPNAEPCSLNVTTKQENQNSRKRQIALYADSCGFLSSKKKRRGKEKKEETGFFLLLGYNVAHRKEKRGTRAAEGRNAPTTAPRTTCVLTRYEQAQLMK